MNRAMVAVALTLGLLASAHSMASEVEGNVDKVSVGENGLVTFSLKNLVVYNYTLPACAQPTGLVATFAINPSETTKQALRDMVMSAADGKTKLRVWGSTTCAVNNWPLMYIQGVSGITSTSAP